MKKVIITCAVNGAIHAPTMSPYPPARGDEITAPAIGAADALSITRRGGSAIDGRTTRHPGYTISQTIRKRIEEHFAWGRTVGRIRQTVYRGIKRVDPHFKLTMTGSNIVRMARMLSAVPRGAAQ